MINKKLIYFLKKLNKLNYDFIIEINIGKTKNWILSFLKIKKRAKILQLCIMKFYSVKRFEKFFAKLKKILYSIKIIRKLFYRNLIFFKEKKILKIILNC